MPNTSLIQSPWSGTASLTTGFQMGIKPKKMSLGKYNISDSDLPVDLFSVGADVFATHQSEDGKLAISKYNNIGFEFTPYSTSEYEWNAYYFTTYESKIYILIGNHPDVKLITFDTITKQWTSNAVDNLVCTFSFYQISMTIHPVKVNNVVTKLELIAIGYDKDYSGSLIVAPLFVKCDLETNVWSAIDKTGWIPEGSAPGSNCPAMIAAPTISRHDDGFFYHSGNLNGSFWFYSYQTNTWIQKSATIPFMNPEIDYLWLLLNTGTSLIGVFESPKEDEDDYVLNFRYFKEYDIEKNTWTDLNNFPGMNDDMTYFTIVGNSVYAINPIYGTLFPPNIKYIGYDLLLDYIIPMSFSSLSFSNYQDNVNYYYYGFTNYEDKNIIYRTSKYGSNGWWPIIYPGTIKRFSYNAFCFYNGFLYTFGGCDAHLWETSGAYSATNELYKIDLSTGIATLIDTTGIACYGSSMIGLNDKLYFVGGTTSNPTNEALEGYVNLRYFDLITNTWTVLSDPINAMSLRHSTSLIAKENVIYSISGVNTNSGEISSDIRNFPWKWDTTTNVTTKLTQVPSQGEYNEIIYFKHSSGDLYATFKSPFYEGSSYKFYHYNDITDTYTLEKEYPASDYDHNHNIVCGVWYQEDYNNDRFYIFGEITSKTPGVGYEGYCLISFFVDDLTTFSYVVGNYNRRYLVVDIAKPFCTVPNVEITGLDYKILAPWWDGYPIPNMDYSLEELNALSINDPNGSIRLISEANALEMDGYGFNQGEYAFQPLIFYVRVKCDECPTSDWSQIQLTFEEPTPPPLP